MESCACLGSMTSIMMNSRSLPEFQFWDIWSADKLSAMDDSRSAQCPFCEQCCESRRHLLWECPKFERERQEVWAKSKFPRPDPEALPPALANAGLCPGFVLADGRDVWGREARTDACLQWGHMAPLLNNSLPASWGGALLVGA